MAMNPNQGRRAENGELIVLWPSFQLNRLLVWHQGTWLLSCQQSPRGPLSNTDSQAIRSGLKPPPHTSSCCSISYVYWWNHDLGYGLTANSRYFLVFYVLLSIMFSHVYFRRECLLIYGAICLNFCKFIMENCHHIYTADHIYITFFILSHFCSKCFCF